MNKTTIITGKKHSGKTTKLQEIVFDLQSDGKICAGIIAIGTFKNNKRYSFDLLDISTNEKIEFMSIITNNQYKKIGKFYIKPEGEEFGTTVLEKALKSNANFIVIDEIGALELEEKGWSQALSKALEIEKNIIITVREELLQNIINKFKIDNYNLINQ